jgi:hypothetical protein
MLSSRDSLWIQIHKWVEGNRIEKYISRKQYSKEYWHGYTNTGKNRP